MTYRRLWIILVPLVLILVVIGVWLSRAPRVLEMYPPPGSVVPAGAPVRLAFSRPMRADAVISRLSIEPEQSGELTWGGNTLIFTPDEPWPGGITVTVRLAAGAWSAGVIPSPMLAGETWSFAVEKPRLLYLWPANDSADIYATDPQTGSLEQLTTAGGVRDYCISADGVAVYFSANTASGSADIFRLNRLDNTLTTLLECPKAVCQAVSISPDGLFLAFERLSAKAPTQVWLLPLQSISPTTKNSSEGSRGEVLAGDLSHQTILPAWSVAGRLSFYDVTAQAYVVLDPLSGETVVFPNETGEPGSWSADGMIFVAPEIFIIPVASGDPIAASHLMAYDPAQKTTTYLTQGIDIEDTAPAISPDGQWVAFARKSLVASLWTPGRQLWVMRFDGKDPLQLTNAPFYNHYDFAWRPDGGQLAFVRSNLDSPTDPVELWLVNADGSDPVKLSVGGYAPQWAP